ncbi:MAG: hypothetical protein JWN46_2625 [Acidimicrobiales bacterium]|nr:hypothetical protein [Acidimicrobiales bacterium]
MRDPNNSRARGARPASPRTGPATRLGLALALGLASLGPARPAPGPEGGAVFVPPLQTATSGCTLHDADPDPACTPGVVNPAVTESNIRTTICRSGWSRRQRAKYLPASGPRGSQALKRKVAAYYDPPGVPATSEGDHVISIELGGDPAGGPNFAGANFFDEPHDLTGPDGQPAGSRVKDGFENALHRMVCAHQISLAEAQRQIATDWYGAFEAAGRPTG